MKMIQTLAAVAAFAALSATSLLAEDDAMSMVVTKTPNCGCCTAWADLAAAEGYDVEIIENADYTATKHAHGVPGDLASCHSARIGGYVVEGHVPFAALAKLLRDKPAISGIAVPGMPMGSPGMGDDPTARYDVLSFGGEAQTGEVFYRAGE
ncbi:DUF411 domain-containing protein [Roseovarius sp. M141]|uniref:DUF411 domain-containing protein n=1 Tax=Roseovarius sp. M141 TaxID=2583806 RepID=UPI0020CE3297|nr:DUF411 domain-containing protein [Roseovarius sp. M141]MCQ0093617.1 CopG family transcriptional regulator [Roseovarius sp. M141]